MNKKLQLIWYKAWDMTFTIYYWLEIFSTWVRTPPTPPMKALHPPTVVSSLMGLI